ncbi:MAG TPA: signal recognition particle-docking protein FtsY [Thermoplasmata archaeon]|nr:signal recognition particle-docking protein FtsY [Thermoplasmata archaeon]
MDRRMWAAIKARLRRTSEPAESAPAQTASPPPSSSTQTPGPPAVPPSPPGATDEMFTEGFVGRRLKEGTIDDVLDDLEVVLLQSDVAVPVVERVRRDLHKELAGRKLKFGVDAEEAIRACLERSVRGVLARPPIDLAQMVRTHTPKPYVILFVGVNGTGKTTTVAKLAGWLRGQGFSSVIAAGDTFRAGAIDQLLVHGERLGVRVIRQQEGSDPAAVAFDAVAHAKAKGIDVVLVDTAGRQHTNDNLIEEAKKIRRVVAPALTLFVGDALTGNDVVEQARMFDKAVGIDGLVLTKLDADAKGGAALSATYVTKKPILFVGVGQGYGDFRTFDPDWMVRRLFAEGTAG